MKYLILTSLMMLLTACGTETETETEAPKRQYKTVTLARVDVVTYSEETLLVDTTFSFTDVSSCRVLIYENQERVLDAHTQDLAEAIVTYSRDFGDKLTRVQYIIRCKYTTTIEIKSLTNINSVV